MSIVTPIGPRYLSGHEERLMTYFATRLVKVLRSQHLSEKTEIHYEGPTIQGEGAFHEFTAAQKIVALHLAVQGARSRTQPYEMTQWMNGAFECLYSWVLYEISQDFATGDFGNRSVLVKAYQQTISDSRISGSSNDLVYWTEYVLRMAERLVYSKKTEELQGKFYFAKLDFNEKMIDTAFQYFDDGMINDPI